MLKAMDRLTTLARCNEHWIIVRGMVRFCLVCSTGLGRIDTCMLTLILFQYLMGCI